MRVEIAPGVRVFVDVDGPGLVPDGAGMRERPTVVFLHGGPGFDHCTGKSTLSGLSDCAQFIYYDHRGHGRSDRRPLTECALDIWADDVVRLCDALGVVNPIVFGQSFGGMVAQRYIARHPAHPGRVILSSTSAHFGLARKLAWFERLGGAAVRDAAEAFWTRPDAATLKAYYVSCMPFYNTTPQDPQIGERTTLTPEILMHWAKGEKKTMNLLPGLSRAQCPVLVLAGDQDPVTPIDDARDIAAALPEQWVQFHAVAGAGHGAWRDKQNEAFAVLRRFIAAQAQQSKSTP